MIRQTIASLLLLACATAARADIVRLSFGDSFGQGWMFLDTDGGCKIVTAGHVVKGSDGRPRPMLVLDATGHEWTAGLPTLLSDDPDIAVIPVPTASNPRTCGDGRLSAIGVERRVTNLADATIRTTGKSEVRNVAVTRRASVIDSHGGSVFAVAQTAAGEPFAEGWSGSVVLDRDGPVGIVFEVSAKGDEAYAVRTDVIREMMAAAPAAPSPVAVGTPSVVVDTGATVNPVNGPNQIVTADGGYWMVRPTKRTVIFDLQLAAPTQLQRVALATGWAVQNQVTGVDVSSKSDPSDADWTWAKYCKSTDDEQTSCRFLKRTVSSVRIRLQTRTDAPIAIRHVTVQ